MSELHEAGKSGDHAKAVALLDAGADYDAVDEHSMTPAHWAAYKGHLLVVRLCIMLPASKGELEMGGFGRRGCP